VPILTFWNSCLSSHTEKTPSPTKSSKSIIPSIPSSKVSSNL
jgi:hypothetical protein